MPLSPLMLAGTGSDVGKSVLATALCRILLQDGYHPAPFKAQNMALNSGATADGYEIGRAQMVQAEACCIPATTDMNPLLLKPNSDHTSQVVLNGKPVGNLEAYDYFHRPSYRHEVCEAFDRLAAHYNPIVMEGAGSICELNLRQHDIVNLPMARHAQAKVLLVADIDKGGVFAQCYGSIMLQEPSDRALIKGIIVNKFRGDIRLFEEGRRMLEEVCGVPVLGVIPYYRNIHIEEEDSVSLRRKNTRPLPNTQYQIPAVGLIPAEGTSKINIAVVTLHHISNFTDFDSLERAEHINLFYTASPTELEQADIIILPGTKSTLADLRDIRSNGIAEAILHANRRGTRIIGICGGYQMLGQSISDPEHVEGDVDRMPGLGLLPTHTVMQGDKVTEQVTFRFQNQTCRGYEIHQGRTTLTSNGQEPEDKVLCNGNVCGTYVHGLLDNAAVINWLTAPFGHQEATLPDYQTYKEQQYNLLADHVRRHLDMKRLYRILQQE